MDGNPKVNQEIASSPTRSELAEIRKRYERELLDRVIPFWMKHSPDREHGGYFNCLDRDGTPYDKTKYIWLQGREAWIFSKLYREVEQKPEWLDMARRGIDFLRAHAIRPDGRVYFRLSQDGKPMTLQRKIFAECFYVMALAEFSRASGEQQYLLEAQTEFAKVWEFSLDLTKVGRPKMSGEPELQNLAVPMILLNLIEELTDGDTLRYRSEIDACIRRMLMHVHAEKKLVFENVTPDGALYNSPEGRLLNPGHAIEAGWFLQHWAQRLERPDLSKVAIDMVRWSHDKGWDTEHDGLFYFLDANGYSPTQLEWDMKLWWPHNEAQYAHLLNFSITNEAQDWQRFKKIDEYAFSHFPDEKYGEWYGYLNRRGEVTHRFKGGPYKCCFHVPRALWLCWKKLKELESRHQ